MHKLKYEYLVEETKILKNYIFVLRSFAHCCILSYGNINCLHAMMRATTEKDIRIW